MYELNTNRIPANYRKLLVRMYKKYLRKYNDEARALGKAHAVVRDTIVYHLTGEPSVN